MEEIKSEWTDDDTEMFVKYGHCFVPEREKQLEIICDILNFNTEKNKNYSLIDLCPGEGILSEAILKAYPRTKLYLYDFSRLMLETAAKRLQTMASKDIEYKIIDITKSDWRDESIRVDAVVSSLSVHHLEGKNKLELFKYIYKILNYLGKIIIADLILPTTQEGMLIAAKGWDEHTYKRAMEINKSPDAFSAFQSTKWNYFYYPDDPLDKPSSLFEQLCWLSEVGFKKIDVHWLAAGHSIFSAIKE